MLRTALAMRSRLAALAWLHLLATAQAYTTHQQLPDAIQPSKRPHDVANELNQRFQHTGVPVPRGWHPQMDSVGLLPALRQGGSVAKRTEELVAPEATITYIHPTMTSRYVRFGSHKQSADLQTGFHRSQTTDDSGAAAMEKETAQEREQLGWPAEAPRVDQPGLDVWKEGEASIKKAEAELNATAANAPGVGAQAATVPAGLGDETNVAQPGLNDWKDGEAETKRAEDEMNAEANKNWMRDAKIEAENRAEQYIKDRAFKDAANAETKEIAKRSGTYNKTKEKIEANTWPKKTGVSRCGFSWDDAAAKMGESCTVSDLGGNSCQPPPGTVDNPKSYWFNQSYECYNDMPDIGVRAGGRVCHSISNASSDSWCMETCSTGGSDCNPVYCACVDDGTGLEDADAFKIDETFDVTAPIQAHDSNITAPEMPTVTAKLREAVIKAGEAQLSGLPACTWRPSLGCSNESQFECIKGPKQGRCSGRNWFDRPAECKASCVHTVLLRSAPYYALWYPGPLAKDFRKGEEQPRYKHATERSSLRVRGVDVSKSDVMMSDICKSDHNHFAGITLYSPKYQDKAERLLRSCARVGICCKATLLPANTFGPKAKEGSEAFRYEAISLKPSFILNELESTQLPVVFLDTDMEFHSFPHLFVPGSWPSGGRDVAMFNFWGNESDWEHASTPQTASGVVFFNQTKRAKNLLRAWAEAMAWPANFRAPDDQVLDTLLKKGGWLARASFGWLPAAYLRTMPAYYRGVDPVVIDHDHGNMPGLLNHSTRKPELPPIERMELCPTDEPAPIRRDEDREDQDPESRGDGLMLPAGTCGATNPDLKNDDQAQRHWNNWCDENCVPSKWGAVGMGGCRDGSETGVVGCVCKQGVEPVKVAEEAAKRKQREQEADAKAEKAAAQEAERSAKDLADEKAAREREAKEESDRKAEEERAFREEEKRRGEAAEKELRDKEAAEEARRKAEAEGKAGNEFLSEQKRRAAEAEEEVRRAEEVEDLWRQSLQDAKNRALENHEMRKAAGWDGENTANAEREEELRVQEAEAEVEKAVATKEEWMKVAREEKRKAAEAEASAEAEATGERLNGPRLPVTEAIGAPQEDKASTTVSRPRAASPRLPVTRATGPRSPEASPSPLPVTEAVAARPRDYEEPEGTDIAPEASDDVPVVVVQDDTDVGPDGAPVVLGRGACRATNPVLEPAAREDWNLWCEATCQPNPANCATPAMTGTAECVCA